MSFQLENPTRIISKCRNVIKEILHYRNLGFSNFDKSGNCVVYELSGDMASRAEAKYPYQVLPFMQSEAGLNYWIAITVEFQFLSGIYIFREVCVIIFEGMAADNYKQPILRAEWADRDPISLHAQPHWHVYPSFINKNIAPLFEAEQPTVDFESSAGNLEKLITTSDWEEGRKFHFAMASRWHIGEKNLQIENIDEEKLTNWLMGCISYIRDQLAFVNRKA